GIVTRTGLHCAPLVHEKIDGGAGSVRISLSCFTTNVECKTAADAILEIAKNAASRLNSA
ncbi:MAG TPA: aminotransferase class V, partial [Methanocorpusculum sp.]|nr:aminotransferase class V [Methanocorpusculum sp.]